MPACFNYSKQHDLQSYLLLLGTTGHILVHCVTVESRNEQAETAESDDSMMVFRFSIA